MRAVRAGDAAAVPAGPPAVEVDDPSDPRLGDYVGLTDVGLRRRLEPAGGLFIAEGELVVRRALRAGYRPRSLLLGHRWGDVFADVPVIRFLASQRVLDATTGFHVHRGVLGSFERRPLPSVESVVAASRRLAVLEQVNSSTNLGAIFRSAAALGMDGVLLDQHSCDPLYRRAVRVSMVGIPWKCGGTDYEGWSCQRHAGSSIRSSGRVRFGSCGRPGSRSRRSPGTWGSTRGRWGIGAPGTEPNEIISTG